MGKRNFDFEKRAYCCVFCRQEKFFNEQGRTSHLRGCQPYRDEFKLGLAPDTFGSKRAWTKGLTKYDHPAIMNLSKLTSERLKNKGNPLSKWNTNKPYESYKRQSETRKRKYASGDLSPSTGVGRGKYSKVKINNKCFLLRSTYEFIFVLFLIYLDIKTFQYESVRVVFEGHTRISDFKIGGMLYEIKGKIKKEDADYLIRAFKSNNWMLSIVDYKDIKNIKNYLILVGLPIKYWLKKIFTGHKKRNYFSLDFDKIWVQQLIKLAQSRMKSS